MKLDILHPTTTLNLFLLLPIRVTCPAQLVFLFSVPNNRNCEVPKYASFKLPVISSTLSQRPFFSILSPSTSYAVIHRVSDPYRATTKVIGLYIPTFMFLGIRQNRLI